MLSFLRNGVSRNEARLSREKHSITLRMTDCTKVSNYLSGEMFPETPSSRHVLLILWQHFPTFPFISCPASTSMRVSEGAPRCVVEGVEPRSAAPHRLIDAL